MPKHVRDDAGDIDAVNGVDAPVVRGISDGPPRFAEGGASPSGPALAPPEPSRPVEVARGPLTEEPPALPDPNAVCDEAMR
eukprot:11980044-Alexandrium_andersonii.AAC.1